MGGGCTEAQRRTSSAQRVCRVPQTKVRHTQCLKIAKSVSFDFFFTGLPLKNNWANPSSNWPKVSAYVKIKIRKATFGKWWSPKQKRLAWLIWNLHINSRLNWPRFQKSANKVVTKEDSKKSLSGKEGDTSEIWSLNVNQDVVSEASHTVSKWRGPQNKHRIKANFKMKLSF